MRKMARIVKIDSVRKHPNADTLGLCMVGGWQVVAKLGHFSQGDKAVYVEIDAWVPHELAPYLTSEGSSPKEYKGVKGQKLKTRKIRKELSQGILLLASEFDCLEVGEDVSAQLNIQKWEPEETVKMRGELAGTFPAILPKTDQERVQNISAETLAEFSQEYWEITEKLEGTSASYYLDRDGAFFVCSRNCSLKLDDSHVYGKIAIRHNIEQKMKEHDLFGYGIQGEIIGAGVQGNPYKMGGIDFRVFDVFDTNSGKYLSHSGRIVMIEELGLQHVPVISCGSIPDTMDEILHLAEGKSVIANTEREGLVFKHLSRPEVSFKAVSNKYLLKGDS